MILYFSGTGNSRLVAKKMAAELDDICLDICQCTSLVLADNEPLGLVFPVYAWGLPQILERYISQHVKPVLDVQRYVWAVMTCGDDMGYADRVLTAALGRSPQSVFSVQMPNTYVCLPGFDIDADDLAARKVSDTLHRLPALADAIRQHRTGVDVKRGDMPWLKTYVLRPLFNKYLVTDKYFRATDACNGCGLCARQCPMTDILMQDRRPQWRQTDCTGCLRCYHQCPQRAIEWGRYTKGKGQKN